MKRGLWIGAAILVAAAAAIPLWLVVDDGGDRRAGALSPERSSAGAWSIELDGVKAGPAVSVAGCVTEADVGATETGVGGPDKKHISSPSHGECVLQVTGLSLPLRNWVKSMLEQNQAKKNVLLSIRNADGSGVLLNLPNTLMSGFAVPVLKVGDSKPVTFEVALAPENIQRSTGPVVAAQPPKDGMPVAGTFRFELDGAALSLSSFEGFTVKQKFTQDDLGEQRLATKQPTKLDLGNLEVRLNETSTKSGASVLDSYFQSFVVQGNSDDSAEKSASLILSDALGKQVLRFNFSNVGAYSREPVAREDNARGFGFYVEKAAVAASQ
jgi:hypothetical protein